MDRQRQSTRTMLWVVLTTAAALLLSCSSGDAPTAAPSRSPSGSGSGSASPSPSAVPTSSRYPNAIVVLGHSGTTGFNSDPSAQGADATQNSWATGDNPAVNSIYTRLLALNPAVRGHSTNVGVDGADIDDLGAQVDQS